MNIDIGTTVMIAIFAGIILAAGAGVSFYIGRKQNTDEDWMVGGRKLPLYVIAFTQYATAVGGGVLVAHVGISYAWGLSVFWYEVFVAVGMLVIAAPVSGSTMRWQVSPPWQALLVKSAGVLDVV